MKLLTPLILTALLAPMAFADALSDNLMAQLIQSDLLEDFWAGDDGEPCHEPTVKITAIDRENSTAYIVVHQNGSAIGCFEQSWQCEVEFQQTNDQVVLLSNSENLICHSY